MGMGGGATSPAGPPNPAATVIMGEGTPSPSAPPSTWRIVAPPLPLRPASAVFAASQPPAISPVLVRRVGGPATALLVAILTLLVSNRIWPPATGSGGKGPSLFALKSRVQIISTPPGATVFVNGTPLRDKTPTYVEGDVGKKAQVKIVLEGFEPREAVVLFTKDERPPLRVVLFRPGQGPVKEHVQDPTLYEDRPGTKTAPEPDSEPEGPTQDKPTGESVAQAPEPAQEARQPRVAAAQATKEPVKEAAEPSEARAESRRGHPKKGQADKATPPKGKGRLTVLVRPWAIVYIDNKKIKQTPLRDFPLSPGKHTVLLVNDNKGKRETVSLTMAPGAAQTITRDWN